MIIGLLGKAGSGKSTVANLLSTEHGFVKFSLAEPLKKMAILIWDLSQQQVWGSQVDKQTVDPRWGKSPRELLQFLGTDVCRQCLGEDVWIDAAMHRIKTNTLVRDWVCEDVRFANEARAIQSRGGIVVRLDCPDAPPSGQHVSEQIEGVPFDFVIVSKRADGDLLDLARSLFDQVLR